ncbi:hypothetical protein BGX20_000945 [Mortierella sp. AD010]|nr:hypothetical protein BGX20_000945 [Mortierella sp. AD010]
MHTAELITLLRSHERTHPKTKGHLAALDQARRLHLLGELSNWLLAELQKYRDRQAGPTSLETPQQGSLRSQIRHTLLAIQVLLDNFSSESTSPPDVKPGSVSKTSVLLNDKGKEKVLESFLRPILIGISPLGPRVDSTDVQLLCAKIICYCTNPLTKNAPFQPQVLFKTMMTMTQRQESQEWQSTNLDRGHGPGQLTSDAVVGFTALLRSPMIKLQDYALRILTSHKSIVQIDQTWELLIPLKSVLEGLRDSMVRITTDQQVELFGQDLGTVRASSGSPDVVIRSGSSGGMIKELESAITIQSKALTLLQWYLQEAGKSSSAPVLSSTSSLNFQDQMSGSRNYRRLSILKEAADVGLLADIWRAIQHIVLFERSKLAAVSERLVLLTSASIYWICWVFQDNALTYIISESADTLMAWYGYYITPHDQVSGLSSSPSSPHPEPLSTYPAREMAQEKTDLKHQSSVLEYLSKLIQNMVASKKHYATLFAGNPPVGIVIMRRTIEFLEGILESSLPVMSSRSNPDLTQPLPDTFVLNVNHTPTDTKPTTYPIWIIQERPGVLEAMLGIMTGCYGGSQGASSLVLNSQLLHILLLLLSNIRNLFDIHNLAESTARKVRQLSLNMLLLILKHDSSIPGIEDVPMDHWTLGYQALVDMIMLPLESEVNAASDQLGAHAAQNMTVDEDLGVKSLRAFTFFWKHHTKGRGILSDLLAPRLHQLRMVPIVLGDQHVDKIPKWRRERTLLLLETIVYFGSESSVRINMRERWSSLPFLVATLGSSMKRLESNEYSPRDTLSRMAAKRCFMAMRKFWYDRLGLVQMIELDLSQSESHLWDEMMPPSVRFGIQTSNLSTSASVVPLLVAILSPLRTNWSSELMLRTSWIAQRTGRQPRHPLFERRELLLVEAAMMLAQLSQFRECQERLVSKPGAIWMVSRIMVERSLVTNSDVGNSGPIVESDEAPLEQLEKSLFEALTRIMSSESLAKSLVSNNTITELFAAIMEMDMPMYFYRSKAIFEGKFEGLSIFCARKSIYCAETARPETELDEKNGIGRICMDQILPTLRQHELHRQLLQHFRTVMTPQRGQFERIYQYIGGHRSLQDMNDSSETVFWLREYCALVFTYTLEPPTSSSSMFWGSRIDKTALLNSESIFGIVCRMLTLEMEYDDSGDASAKEPTSVNQERNATDQQNDVMNAQKEEALLRRFSAGLAIQSLCWKHVEQWSGQHLDLVRSYGDVTTTEWEKYTNVLKGKGDSGSISSSDELAASIENRTSVDFMIQDRVISFPDRLILSRTSEFFHTLLMGEYKEAHQKHIVLQDVDPDDFELLMEVVKESQLTVQLLLPEDLPLALVLRLMVCANRFMVTFVKRLAEAWILEALSARELKHYEMKKHSEVDVADAPTTQSDAKHHSSPTSESQGKRRKIDHTDEGEEESDLVDDLESQDDKDSKEGSDAGQHEVEESIHESLLMVYEACSNPRHGTLYSTTHPFHCLVWDVLKRMALRLGYVAATPRFATMLSDGGEEVIQEFLQIFYDLILNNVPTTK